MWSKADICAPLRCPLLIAPRNLAGDLPDSVKIALSSVQNSKYLIE